MVRKKGKRSYSPRAEALILLVIDQENAEGNLPKTEEVYERLKNAAEIRSRGHVYAIVNDLIERGILEKVDYGLKRHQPDIEESLLKQMKDYDIVAYAPFSPVIAGAHAVLSGHRCLILPLNAYVGIGLRKIKETGGEVICGPLLQPRYGEGDLTQDIIEDVANFAMKIVNEPTGYSLVSRPSYKMQLFSDIDATLGCGGSGAVAVAGSLCFMSAFNLLSETGPFTEYKSENQLRLFLNAFKIENYIHGKGLHDELGPFSSGASVFGSIVGSSEARLYEYWITPNGLEDFRNHKRQWPDYDRSIICTKFPSDRIFLVLGEVKMTSSCIRHVLTAKKIIGEDLVDSLFEVWGKVVDRLAQEFRRYEAEAQLRTESISRLFSIQHSLYMSLGLGNKKFTYLLLNNSDKEMLSGSVIGAGKGGTCLYFAPEGSAEDFLNQLPGQRLECLPSDEFLKQPSAGARILKRM
jgi:mevalonate kinase